MSASISEQYKAVVDSFQRGDIVVFFCENTVEGYISKFGIAKAGAVGAPINPRMAPDVQDHLQFRQNTYALQSFDVFSSKIRPASHS